VHKRFLLLGAVSALIGVAAGAFGAHGLEAQLATESLAVYETGVRYQLIHAISLLFIGLAADRWPAAGWGRAGWMFVAGTVLFCGSLYALAFTSVRAIGVVTPVGGVCFLVGWALAALAGTRSGAADGDDETRGQGGR
jgi:uncharacterized membrane protein YgdD (TMEM256/DUF423 family)